MSDVRGLAYVRIGDDEDDEDDEDVRVLDDGDDGLCDTAAAVAVVSSVPDALVASSSVKDDSNTDCADDGIVSAVRVVAAVVDDEEDDEDDLPAAAAAAASVSNILLAVAVGMFSEIPRPSSVVTSPASVDAKAAEIVLSVVLISPAFVARPLLKYVDAVFRRSLNATLLLCLKICERLMLVDSTLFVSNTMDRSVSLDESDDTESNRMSVLSITSEAGVSRCVDAADSLVTADGLCVEFSDWLGFLVTSYGSVSTLGIPDDGNGREFAVTAMHAEKKKNITGNLKMTIKMSKYKKALHRAI